MTERNCNQFLKCCKDKSITQLGPNPVGVEHSLLIMTQIAIISIVNNPKSDERMNHLQNIPFIYSFIKKNSKQSQLHI